MAVWETNIFAMSIVKYTSSGYEVVAQITGTSSGWSRSDPLRLYPLKPGCWPLLKYT